MTGEPVAVWQSFGDQSSDARPLTQPMSTADQLSSVDRFPSFADYVVSTASSPQPAATTLDMARFHAFTGELTFAVDPVVRVYLDGGSIYYAERDGDPPVRRVLLDAGVIEAAQLERGVVRAGHLEHLDHLGRLFERESTVDRDAVVVVVEHATAALIQEMAASIVAMITASAYRHHPSGIHRWFDAAAAATGSASRGIGVSRGHSAGEDVLTIDWAESLASSGQPPDPGGVAVPTNQSRLDVQAELDRFDADRADWAGMANTPPSRVVASPIGEFRIVWPDGTEDETIVDAASDGVASMPRRDDRVNEAESSIPDDVETAVRRALQAIESAPTSVIALRTDDALASTQVPSVADADVTTSYRHVIASSPIQMEAFAPPTPDTHADVLYQRSADAASAIASTPALAGEAAPNDTPPAIASPDVGGLPAAERRGPLRRFIDGLRNTD